MVAEKVPTAVTRQHITIDVAQGGGYALMLRDAGCIEQMDTWAEAAESAVWWQSKLDASLSVTIAAMELREAHDDACEAHVQRLCAANPHM